jgi:integrin beta 2
MLTLQLFSIQVIVSVMPQHIFGMALHGDYLYWTDWVARAAVRANKYDGSGTKILRTTDRQPMGIVAFARDTNNCKHRQFGLVTHLLTH